MKGVLQILLEPYRTYTNRIAQEKKLQTRDTINLSAIKEEQKILIVERDLNKILEDYIDSGEAEGVIIDFDESYKDLIKSYLKSQEIDFIEYDNDQILIRGG